MSKEITKHEAQPLPKLEELYGDLALQKGVSELATLLNAIPPKQWIQEHPIAKNVLYIPIEIQEFLMTRIFGDWFVEVKDIKLIANSVSVTLRVNYWWHFKPNEVGEWRWTEGVGAAALQTEKGAGATEFDKIKSNAVQIGLPAAKSYAFKDAVESLGRIFGKDLNRKHGMDYYSLLYTKDGQERFNPVEVTAPEVEHVSEDTDLPDFLRKK